MNEFYDLLSGKSFLNGIYRWFKTDDIEKWIAITGQSFTVVQVEAEMAQLRNWLCNRKRKHKSTDEVAIMYTWIRFIWEF